MSRIAIPQTASRLLPPSLRPFLRTHALNLVILIGVGLFLARPFMSNRIVSGVPINDALWWVPRTVEVAENLRAGNLIPRWAPDFNYGYGEPSLNYFAWLVPYLAALVHLAGVDVIVAVNVVVIGQIIAALLVMYLFTNRLFSPTAALIAALAYAFNPWASWYLFANLSLSQVFAGTMMPLALLTLTLYTLHGGRWRLLLAAGSLLLLILTSNPMTLIFLPVLIFAVVWLAISRRSLDDLLRGVIALCSGLALGAFFWLPALTEKRYVYFERHVMDWAYYERNFFSVGQLFYRAQGLSPFPIGPVHIAGFLATLVLSVWLSRRMRLAPGLLVVLLVTTVGAAFMVTGRSRFIWAPLPLLQSIQVPMRFLSIVAITASICVGAPFLYIERRWPALLAPLTAATMVALAIFGLAATQVFNYHTNQYLSAEWTPSEIVRRNNGHFLHITVRESEPRWVKQYPAGPAPARLETLAGSAQISPLRDSRLNGRYRVDVSEPSLLRVNTWYYPGWTILVDDQVWPFTVTDPDGLMVFPLTEGAYTVRVELRDTPIRQRSEWLSGLTALTLLALALAPRTLKLPPAFGRRRASTAHTPESVPAEEPASSATPAPR